jgi:hypothetical protein
MPDYPQIVGSVTTSRVHSTLVPKGLNEGSDSTELAKVPAIYALKRRNDEPSWKARSDFATKRLHRTAQSFSPGLIRGAKSALKAPPAPRPLRGCNSEKAQSDRALRDESCPAEVPGINCLAFGELGRVATFLQASGTKRL